MQLPSLLGNPRLKSLVARMPQAPGTPLVLEGPGGSGKRTAAADLAAALLCRQPHGPCGVCPACVRYSAGSHPDYHLLAYEGKAVKVQQVRELRARTFLKPQEAAFKVFVIHAAHLLSDACQNALLKVLEEPAGCAFILLCDNREALLQTIRSRCIACAMEPLDSATLIAALRDRGVSGDLEVAMAASGGYLGQALAQLTGEAPPHLLAAQALTAALDKGELAIYRAAQEAIRLNREDYAAFLDALCAQLTHRAKATGDPRYVSLYAYVGQQQALLEHNPSLTGLGAALTAFCGQVMEQDG